MGNIRAKTLKVRAEERGDAYCDQTSEHKIVNRDAVRQELWQKAVLLLLLSRRVGIVALFLCCETTGTF